MLSCNRKDLLTAFPSTVFFVATKRCNLGGAELPVGPPKPERQSPNKAVGGEILGLVL